MDENKELPGWLETLWNIKAELAERAEKDYFDLKEKVAELENRLAGRAGAT